VKLYWVSASWIAETVSAAQPAEIAFALDLASTPLSFAVPPAAPTADYLTALLI